MQKIICIYLKDGNFLGLDLKSRGVEAEDEEIIRHLKKYNVDPDEIEGMEEEVVEDDELEMEEE